MTGDRADFISRLKAVLPTRWFPDAAPALEALLGGFATAWSSTYALLSFVRAQTRLTTASGPFLDTIGLDFFGSRLGRRGAEPDDDYRQRIAAALTREHATRPALDAMLLALTGTPAKIFEPARPADTGAYGSGGLGYAAAGAWGNLALPFQVFVHVQRPRPAGIATIAGYGTGGPLARATLAETGGQVTDTDIYAAITSVLPSASIAWTSISN